MARDVTNRYAYQKLHNYSFRQGDMQQVFLPFAMDAKGRTLFEEMVEEKF